MLRRLTLAVSAALVAPAFLLPSSQAHASDAPVIAGIEIVNNGGGLSPYVHLYSEVEVTVTDDTPRPASAYRLRVRTSGTATYPVRDDGTGTLVAAVPVADLPVGRASRFSIEELRAGEVVATSAPRAFTARYVKHPRVFRTSSRRIDGAWSYVAGSTARFRFTGRWEPGTRFSTQVWVSKRKRFTPGDYQANVSGDRALVARYDARKPVLSVKIPASLAGQYVWVSVLGWKDGTAGWTYQVPAERVVRR